jgi:dolichol-phosphate mannosyltransferase
LSEPVARIEASQTPWPEQAPVELSVVVPTFNERGNVGRLVAALDQALKGISWEVIFVDDDSPDETARAVIDLAAEDSRVRCLHRIGRRGLSTACIEGMLASCAPYMAVIDGDLQHDETKLPEMLALLRADECEIVVGSRYVDGGGIGEWDSERASQSRLATRVAKRVLKADLSDPMSGFFMLKREVLDNSVRKLSGIGFKILFDIFASSPGKLRYREVPYTFRTRSEGESKMDTQAVWDYGMLILDKLVGRYVPVRFVAFTMVGGVGVAVHMAVVAALYVWQEMGFVASQAIATYVAMTFNYAVNNSLTYRDRQLKGWGWWKGLVSFTLACSVGALANVGIASYIFESQSQWLLAAGAGILVGAVWNYAVTMVYTWNKRS